MWQELENVKSALWTLTDDLRASRIPPGSAGALTNAYNTIIRVIAEQRSVYETEVLETKLEELEEQRSIKEAA